MKRSPSIDRSAAACHDNTHPRQHTVSHPVNNRSSELEAGGSRNQEAGSCSPRTEGNDAWERRDARPRHREAVRSSRVHTADSFELTVGTSHRAPPALISANRLRRLLASDGRVLGYHGIHLDLTEGKGGCHSVVAIDHVVAITKLV